MSIRRLLRTGVADTLKLAITGSTGFVGQALLRLIGETMPVRLLVRDRSRAPKGPNVITVQGDLTNQDALSELVDGVDAVIHLAGVTHARSKEEYFSANVDGAINVANAAHATGARLVHTSSLSAREPHLSPYAESKAAAELALKENFADANWIALRLPAIYGPHDVATLPFFKLVRAGIALRPASQTPARASLMYVDDAASAVLSAASCAACGLYDVPDDTKDGRSWQEIGATLAAILNVKAHDIAAPRFLVSLVHGITQLVEATSKKRPSIRAGQAAELFHPDWVAKSPHFGEVSDWRAQTPLEEGFAKTVRWYQDNALL